MSEKEVKESQKTVVAFIAGLLVGGLLVWIFGVAPDRANAPEDTDDTTPAENTDVDDNDDTDSATTSDTSDANDDDTSDDMNVGNADVDVDDQPAGSVVRLNGATFPTEEGWIAVRQYNNGQLGSILGAIQYSKAAGRTPREIPLVAPTTAGREYAIVFFSQDKNRAFNLDGDVQLDTELMTFTAQ